MRVLTGRADALHAEITTPDFRALCEEVFLGEEQPEASVVGFSYLKDGGADRPVLFAFNGGPGSSSLWQHLGFLGPWRARLTAPVNPSLLPPYEIEENPHCFLDVCDVVLIDPPGTGYARLYDQSKGDVYFSCDGDARAVALFIRDWLIRHNRVNSPRWLMGESYGTYRMPYVARELMGGPMTAGHMLDAFPVSGVILLGLAFLEKLPFPASVLRLPAYACANRYHNPERKLSLNDWKERAYKFSGDYLKALLYGSADALENEFRRYAGVSGAAAENFTKTLLADRGLDMGAYDARYTMPHADGGDPVADDPAMGKYAAAYVGAWEARMKERLGIKTDRDYRAIDFTVNGRWNFESQSGLKPAQAMRLALRRNAEMKVLIGTGVYDLVTDVGTARYTAHSLGFPERVSVREYESGHMPYIGEESAAALKRDIAKLIGEKR